MYYFFIVSHPDHVEATRRTLDFSLGGLEEVAKECAKLNIEFHLLQDMTKPMAERVLDFVKESKVGCVVTDFSPLHAHRYIKLSHTVILLVNLKENGLNLILPYSIARDSQEP